MTAALLCALVVAMTFVPLLGLLHPEATKKERANGGGESASEVSMVSTTGW